MHLSNLKLWNFRKFGTASVFDLENPNLDLCFTKGLNVLIGENDSGKSAIIDAIKLSLKTHSYEWFRIEWDDFHESTDRLRIELRFDGFSEDEAKNFTEYLGWNGQEDDIKPYLRLIYDATRNLEDKYINPTEIRAGVDETGHQISAEAKEYLKTTYLKPLRDAKSELIPRKNSRLTQILQGHEAFKGKDKDHMLVNLFQEFNEHVVNYFEGKDKDENALLGENLKGKALKGEIDDFIHSFYSKDKESNFGVLGNNLKNILEKLELSIKEELNPGLGTLNRLFMASELLHIKKKNWHGLRLGLIEELEAHLHPQAQMQIIEALQNEQEIQLILTTHSPNLASKIKLENLIICNESNAFPMGSSYTNLKPDNYKFLEKFLDTTKANLFFAKGVSIVNIGNTGFDHYSKIYLRQKPPHMQIPIAVVTDSDIREYEKVLDLDSEGKPIKDKSGKNQYNYLKKDDKKFKQETQSKLVQITAKSKQKVKYYPAPSWTLEYSLFNSTSLSESFKSVCKFIHSRSDWKTDFEMELAKKLINKSLNKTEIAYQMANRIDEDLKKSKEDSTINIDSNNSDDKIYYLVQAIKYAAGS